MLKDNPALNSPAKGEFDLVKYVVKATRKSQVPNKIENEVALRKVACLIHGMRNRK